MAIKKETASIKFLSLSCINAKIKQKNVMINKSQKTGFVETAAVSFVCPLIAVRFTVILAPPDLVNKGAL